jgi:mono/diheme cytochrome c family protein
LKRKNRYFNELHQIPVENLNITRMNKLTLIILTFVFLTACGNKKQNAEKSVIVQTEKSAIVQAEKTNTMVNHPGKKVYNSVCLACHMRNGTGVPGMHPPITKSEFVNGDPNRLIKIVIEGLSGEMEIQGEIYNSIMPPQAHLTDQQIADVLTFVRGSFGNNSGPISLEKVQKIRNKN